MNTESSILPGEAELHQEIERAQVELNKLEQSLQSVLNQLDNEAGVKERFDALEQVCVSLEKLDELGGFDLFLGEDASQTTAPAYIEQIRDRVSNYENAILDLQNKRDQIQHDIREKNNQISLSQEAIIELREEAEQRKHEFIIEREIPKLPFRPMVMPWSKDSSDEKLIRKYLAIAIAFSLFLMYVLPMVDVPLPDPTEEVKIPERLAKLLKKEEPKPEPQETKPDEDRPKDDKPSKTKDQARKKAEKSGVLAFKDNFTELMGIASVDDLGANASVDNSGAQSQQAARNLVVSKSSAISGISSSAVSRNTGGASKGVTGVQFSRVESSIGLGDGGPNRPTAGAEQPRSDEEIQIIFDLYRHLFTGFISVNCVKIRLYKAIWC
ncbi:MAG: hypothetical protein OEZ38_06890 [Gammaproteobacteria bacterium]|nr:hypothetical protein [Gammaproteobacteria bacterium]